MPREAAVPEATLVDNLAGGAARHPDKPIIVFGDAVLRYGEALARVEWLAGWLQQRCGVKRGDRVLLFGQNCPAWVLAYYAILRADAVVVPVSAMATSDDLAYHASDAGANLALVGREMADRALACRALRHVLLHDADGLDAQGVPGTTGWREVMAARLRPAPAQAGPDDLCVLPYTSGTTRTAPCSARCAARASGAGWVRTRWRCRWRRCSTCWACRTA